MAIRYTSRLPWYSVVVDISASEQLTSIEEKMVRAIEMEWNRWQDADGPLPSALVMLLDKAHKAIFSRIGKSEGMDLNEMMRNPEAALLELDKKKALILKFIEQRKGNVVPFPMAR